MSLTYVHSYAHIFEIINDVFLINFRDKKRGHAQLVGVDQVNEWAKLLRHFNFKNDIVHTRTDDHNLNESIDNLEMSQFMELCYPLVVEILKIANGKISLC